MFESYQWSITVFGNYLIINIAMCFDYYVVSNNVFTPTKGLFNFQGKKFFRKKPSLVPKIPLSFPSPWNACQKPLKGQTCIFAGIYTFVVPYQTNSISRPPLYQDDKVHHFFWLVPLTSQYCGLTYHFSCLVYKLRKVT